MHLLGSKLRLTTVAVLIAICANAFAGGPIKGRVIDKSTGEPLFGVTVQVEGTTNGTVTDFDGNFVTKVSHFAKTPRNKAHLRDGLLSIALIDNALTSY